MQYNNVLNILRGLTFFERNHSNGTPVRSWTLAAYYHPHSLTWRWGFGTQCGRREKRASISCASTVRKDSTFMRGSTFHYLALCQCRRSHICGISVGYLQLRYLMTKATDDWIKFNPLTNTYDSKDGTKVAAELYYNICNLADVLYVSILRTKHRETLEKGRANVGTKTA